MAANRLRNAVLVVTGLCLAGAVAVGAEPNGALKKGKPDLKSATKLAFGPDGILFVGDTAGAALFAIDTGDRAESATKPSTEVKDVSGKIAAMIGTNAQQLSIMDLAVNPRSGNVYLAVSRGRGPEAAPLLVRVKADGKIEEVSLEDVPFAKAEIPGAPDAKATGRGPSPRSLSVTDLAYSDGRVFLAGLSNEEFSSRLIAIPYPFSSEGIDGAAIEIYHGAHGQFETKSPIRTFVTYRIGSEPYMLAAYTCTPLVKVPVSELKAGAHVKGTTIAELGNRNNPLDMIMYQKDGKDYLLMTNSSRGVMKIPTDGAGDAPSITEPVRGGGKKRPPALRNDREPQGCSRDGPARQDARRRPGQSGGRRSESRDHRVAVIGRISVLACLLACGAGRSFGAESPRPGRVRASRVEMTAKSRARRRSKSSGRLRPIRSFKLVRT